MNTQTNQDSESTQDQESDQDKRFYDRLTRLSSAKKQSLINLKQLDEIIHKLDIWFYLDSDHKTNSDYYELFSRLSKLDKLNSKDKDLSCFLMHLKNIRPRIENCCKDLTFKINHSTGQIKLVNAKFCMNYTLCPSCAIRRSRQMYKAYFDRYKILKQKYPNIYTSLVTLTVKNGFDLQERFNHLKTSARKLHEHGRRARNEERGYKSEFKKVIASFCNIEVTKESTGWHVHGHFIVLHDRTFDYDSLQAEWKKITGDSHILNVRQINELDDAIEEFKTVFGYVTKSSESESLTPEQTIELYAVTRGQHFCDPYGEFRGINLPKTMIDKDHDDPSFVPMYFRYSPDSGFIHIS